MNSTIKFIFFPLLILCMSNAVMPQQAQQQQQAQQNREKATGNTKPAQGRTKKIKLCSIGQQILQFTNTYPLSFNHILSINDTAYLNTMIFQLKEADSFAAILNFNYFLHEKYFLQNQKWVPEINDLLIEMEGYKSFITQQNIVHVFTDTISYAKPVCCNTDSTFFLRDSSSDFLKQLDGSFQYYDGLELKYIKSYICCSITRLYDSFYNNLAEINLHLEKQHNAMMKYMESTYRNEMFGNLIRKFEALRKAGNELSKNCK